MPFFPGVECTLDLSPNQVSLIQYMNLYDNIDDMDPRDKPPDELIEDDTKFDMWIQDFARRKEAEIRSGDGGSKSASSQKTVYRYDGFEEDEDQEI